MKRNASVVFFIVVAAIVALLTWNVSMHKDVNRLYDSLAALQLTLDSVKAQSPGLGEYMSTLQLHAGKMWFASRTSNWKLAKYELDELDETIEAAEALHARKNNVEISPVLRSVRETQLSLLERALAEKNLRTFAGAYDQTLAACNGCHKAAGYEFIRIVVPTREPVTNQRWEYQGGTP